MHPSQAAACHRTAALRFPRRLSLPAHSRRSRCSRDVSVGTVQNAKYINGDVTGPLEVSAGTLVVHGNITESGMVRATGSVVVIGSIAGKVHAGCQGDTAATIAARRLLTDQLSVAGVSALPPDFQQQVAGSAPPSTMVRVALAAGGQGLQVEPPPPAAPVPSDRRPGVAAGGGAPAWTAPGRLAAFTGCYAVLAGLALTVAPQSTFGLLFNAAEVTTGWIRVGGILFTLIGMQYLGTAVLERNGGGAASFYQASVWSRLYLVVGFALLVATGQSAWGVGLLAAINAAGALSMLRALAK